MKCNVFVQEIGVMSKKHKGKAKQKSKTMRRHESRRNVFIRKPESQLKTSKTISGHLDLATAAYDIACDVFE